MAESGKSTKAITLHSLNELMQASEKQAPRETRFRVYLPGIGYLEVIEIALIVPEYSYTDPVITLTCSGDEVASMATGIAKKALCSMIDQQVAEAVAIDEE